MQVFAFPRERTTATVKTINKSVMTDLITALCTSVS